MDDGQLLLTWRAGFLRTFQERRPECCPSTWARIEDLGRGDLLRVDCAACHHVALLTPESLLRLGLSPQAKMLDLNHHLFEPKY